MKELIAKDKILIEAPVAKVWEVLVAPKFIRQWDALPEDFADYYLEVGREIIWSGNSKITVTEMLAHERLRLALYVTKWELPPSAYDIGYTYQLSESDGFTFLSIEVGDFNQLANGAEYYEESVMFAKKVLKKIKSLAENRV
jgi:uncharacterized protein YndB with AHSA1/START domain